jgi:hypothetical protein
MMNGLAIFMYIMMVFAVVTIFAGMFTVSPSLLGIGLLFIAAEIVAAIIMMGIALFSGELF